MERTENEIEKMNERDVGIFGDTFAARRDGYKAQLLFASSLSFSFHLFSLSLSLSLSLSNSLSSYIILRFLSCFDYNFSLTFCLHFWSRFQMLPLHFLFVLFPS